MARFEDVLDVVRLAFSRATTAEIQALLQALVAERVISEAYSKSLGLHQLTGEMAPGSIHNKLAWRAELDQIHPRGSATHHGHLTDHKQTSLESVLSAHGNNGTNARQKVHEDQFVCVNTAELIQELRRGPTMDEHGLNRRITSPAMTCDGQSSVRLDEMAGLLTSAEPVQETISDSERKNKGNLKNEKEWLEKVEEVARRIAVPLWQHWDSTRRMLLPLVPCMATGCTTNTWTDHEAQGDELNMEEETELEIACRALDLYNDSLKWMESDNMDPSLTLDTGGAADSGIGLMFSAFNSMEMNGTDTDHFSFWGNVSPVEACTATDTSNMADTCLEGQLSVCWGADRLRDTTVELTRWTGDTQYSTGTGFTNVADSPSSCAPKDAHNNGHDNSLYPKTDHSMALGIIGNLENVLRTSYGTTTCSTDCMTHWLEIKEDEERVNSHCGAKMQEIDQDQDPPMSLDFGDLPDDLSEYMNIHEDNLLEMLFGNSLLNCEDNFELPCPGSHYQKQEEEVTEKTSNRRKRCRDPRSQWYSDDQTPSRPKRHRPTGKPQIKEAQDVTGGPQGTGLGPEPAGPSPVETAGLTTTPPRILHLPPSIQFITIPDNPKYQLVQTLRLSPPVIRLPSTTATPTYILVPTTSPPCKNQVQPLSPVDGAVVPVQMSSSPPGSLSDTASKTMSLPCTSPLSPSNEVSPCKESPPPQSPTVVNIPQVVKDYIREVKAHISQTCQEMEEGLSLTSHYVDMRVSQREIFRSGKNTNKCLDKELIIMGDTDRQKSLLEPSQIFEGSNGAKAKRYILLLGNAGMGKTTLIRKLCLEWSRDCIPQFDFVILLDGRALTLTKPAFSLQTLLLTLSSLAPSCVDPEAVYAQILAAPNRVLIIFDGFDELRDYESLLQTQEKDLITSLQKDSKAQTHTVRQLYSAILQRVVLPGCTLLLATRPRGTVSQLFRRADSFLEVSGFTSTHVETYLSQYFTDPTLRASALDSLKTCSYLHRLCWNPGLCRLVCLVLEQSKKLEVLPRTLTGLCHQVLCLKMEKEGGSAESWAKVQPETSLQSEEETQAQVSSNNQTKRTHEDTQTKSRAKVRTHTRIQRARRAKKQEKEEMKSQRVVDRSEDKELLSQLSSLAWEGVKANSSTLPTGLTLSAKLEAFGLRKRLFIFHPLTAKLVSSMSEREGWAGTDKDEMGGEGEKGRKGNRERTDMENSARCDHVMIWANPFLQSFLAAVHLSLSRTISDRTFLQSLPLQLGPKGRRRPQREELELTQRFAVGLLFYNTAELRRLHSYTETSFRDMLVSKQTLVRKHLEGLSYSDLSPAQVLEACRYVYEASFRHGDGSSGGGGTRLFTHLAANLPEVLTFHKVPLNPPDVYTVQKLLEKGGSEGRSFCLDVEDSGIQVSGLRALVGLSNINTYRACIADVITLWEQLKQSGEEALLRGAVSKFKIHPLKTTQVCHVQHLAKLVNIHTHKRLSDSQSDSILAEGVPAVKELLKLEFELGPEKGPLGLPILWELLPGLHNLQHLDLENSKIGDKGAEKLTDALSSLCSLEILNLSQNCIGDHGVKKLSTTLRDLPKLHCLSLYSNVISDEGAESLAAVLPHMASLTDLDVKYNKLTDVGAQSLGASLRNCQKIKTLRMWNQCIPYGVFERLQQQDSRILWH